MTEFTAQLAGQQHTFTACGECNGAGTHLRMFIARGTNRYEKRYAPHRLTCRACGGHGLRRVLGNSTK